MALSQILDLSHACCVLLFSGVRPLMSEPADCNHPGKGLNENIITWGLFVLGDRGSYMSVQSSHSRTGKSRNALFNSNLPDPLCGARTGPDQFSCLSGLSESLLLPFQ